jgi:hypothetical protein
MKEAETDFETFGYIILTRLIPRQDSTAVLLVCFLQRW